jgi:hypothetical protein
MITEPNAWRAAQGIIDRHGANALVVAAQRAQTMSMKYNFDGVASWRRILHAIRELQRMKPKAGERLN